MRDTPYDDDRRKERSGEPHVDPSTLEPWAFPPLPEPRRTVDDEVQHVEDTIMAGAQLQLDACRRARTPQALEDAATRLEWWAGRLALSAVVLRGKAREATRAS